MTPRRSSRRAKAPARVAPQPDLDDLLSDHSDDGPSTIKPPPPEKDDGDFEEAQAGENDPTSDVNGDAMDVDDDEDAAEPSEASDFDVHEDDDQSKGKGKGKGKAKTRKSISTPSKGKATPASKAKGRSTNGKRKANAEDADEFIDDGDGHDAEAAIAEANAMQTGYLNIITARNTQFVPGYIGTYDRSSKGKPLLRTWYGTSAAHLELVRKMLLRWYELPVLPPKISIKAEGDTDARVWTPGMREKEVEAAKEWYGRMEVSQMEYSSRILNEEQTRPYVMDPGSLPVLLGQDDPPEEVNFRVGDAMALSAGGLPAEMDANKSRINGGWLFDAGGIVLSMDWLPRDEAENEQILALAVIPHRDQETYNYEKEAQRPDFQKYGTVQLWVLKGETLDEGVAGVVRPSVEVPRRRKTLCLDRGRARRVQWSQTCGLLAILCGDGSVCIVDPKLEGDGEYEHIDYPVAVFTLGNESTKASSMAWLGTNRLAVGYTDGSIALWSVYPQRLLSRHPIHHSEVIELKSAYPTFPYLVASYPIGGFMKLVDLRAPSYETTETTSHAVNPQPGILAWSDHLLGFFSLLPTSSSVNTVIGFAHYAFFPVVRRVSTPESFATSISAGTTHPFLLVGLIDGSLWCMNPQCEMLSSRYEVSDRIKVFQHQHRGARLYNATNPVEADAAERGASMFLQGWEKEPNFNLRNEVHTAAVKKKVKKAGGDDVSTSHDPKKAAVQEPGSRVTFVVWNPNEGTGTWAACAFASGLVRIMDLGLEKGGHDAEVEVTTSGTDQDMKDAASG